MRFYHPFVFATLVGAAALFCAAQSSPSFSKVRWIVTDSDLKTLREVDPADTARFFNNSLTDVQGHADLQMPPGWSGVPQRHYTAFESCATARDRRCTSLTDDLKSGAVSSSSAPIVLYDNERWPKTPVTEVKDPCNYMQKFTSLAHANGFITVMAPDQNIAGPLVGVAYQGGESQNWQSYLRLGLGTCAARTGTERYHIMAQPFESRWGPTPEGTMVGGEADFINFVTQASLQARAVNPKLVITAGLSANPRYKPTAEIMYRESVDVQHFVDGFWLNLWTNPVGVPYLKMLSGQPPRANSSVLFLGSGRTLGNTMPGSKTAAKFSLAKTGAALTSWSPQTYPAGTVIPAGAWEFQFWSDGDSGTAQVALEFGYCNASDCSRRTPILETTADVRAGALGAADAHGAFTTTSATNLPADAPHALYWALKVVKPAPFNLLYGSASAATNLATPFVQPVR
jgi:hypothetical protein